MARNHQVNFDPNEIHETLLRMSEELGAANLRIEQMSAYGTLLSSRLAAVERFLPALETAHAGTVAPLSDIAAIASAAEANKKLDVV